MNAYLDASVVLRVLLRQADALRQWRSIERGVSSALARVECLRTLDRLRIVEQMSDDDVAVRRESLYRIFDAVELVDVTGPVLDRAALPLPTVLGTLDAIHLATATMWREVRGEELVVATHDKGFGTAARALGFQVIGA